MIEIIIFSLISLLFVLIGLAIKKYKCYWLISGYNTLSKDKKRNVDIEEVGKHIARMCYLIALIIILGAIITKYFEISFFIFAFLIVVVIFGYLFYIQKFDHNKKSIAENIFIVVIAFITFAIMLITFSSGKEPNEIRVTDTSIIIEGNFGTSIKKKDIKELVLVDTLPEIALRVNGYSDGSLIRKGDFKLKNGDRVKLYIESKGGPYIKISTISTEIYINYKDSNKTIESFNNLK
ncbi:DUF3784 domain-containing protein [uncultured Clostridium sp.]|uniref:DUF3784 domain-containing protein n=1 Tax=uncultured Clostridium sp. TaxID=59620 RepID=UPI0025E8DB3C|nr:DUF3784 domain-containing protein [uncultured Clostridium sp.]